MKYIEYMETHANENLSWCKPYTNNDETVYIVVHDGEAESISTPDREIVRGYNGTQDAIDEAVAQIAKDINPYYDDYSGWSDLHIALEEMHECGCASCPFKGDCDAMGEEMNDLDYR